MSNKWLLTWVVCLLLLSAALPLWHRYGMNRAFVLDGNSKVTLSAYDDRGVGGKSVARLDRSHGVITLHCHIVDSTYAWPYCGFSARLGKGTHGVDLSHFKTVSFDIDTRGPMAVPVKVYLRNYNRKYSRLLDTLSLKVNGLQYTPSSSHRHFVVPMANFQVASWWLQARHIAPADSAPDLRDITVLDIDTGDGTRPGHYTIGVHAITFHGKWLTREQTLMVILVLWLASALAFLVVNIWRARHAMQLANLRKDQLEDINAALQLERQQLELVANHDPLTGSWNRTGLRTALNEAVTQSRERGVALSIVFMDLDHFKAINDRAGHDTGDEVLKAFATFVDEQVRNEDMLSRWGGEEFILLCPHTSLELAAQTAERLCAAMKERRWPHRGPLTASFGVARMRAGEDMRRFLHRADKAMYRAKQNGRDQVHVDRAGTPSDPDQPASTSA